MAKLIDRSSGLKQHLSMGPVGRVEGDLDFEITIEDGRVTQCQPRAVMFRGYETILRGKDPWLPLTVTPRICGICGIGHILSAVKAVDMASGNGVLGGLVPPQGLLARNIIGLTESHMSAIRHHWLLFAPDMVNPAFAGWSRFGELQERMAPLGGSSYRAAVMWSKREVEITALFAGQQPHPSAIIPGGVSSHPSLTDITRSLAIHRDVREHFIEKIVLRGSVEDYLSVSSWADLQAWLGRGEHLAGDLGLFIQFALDHGLDRMGQGLGRYLSWAAYEYPHGHFLYPGGTYESVPMYGGRHEPLGDPVAFQKRVTEDITHSFYEGTWSRHPWEEETVPVSRIEADAEGKYSFAKAPRFDGRPMEVGPLARLLVAGDPLIRDMERHLGPSTFLRNFARIHELMTMTPVIHRWLTQVDSAGPFYRETRREVPDGVYFGWTEVHRGALAHWARYENNRVANYQVIAPTTWNVSPHDGKGQAGAIESAVTGVPVEDAENPVFIQTTLRSFDPCLVCTVHTLENGREMRRFTLSV